MKTLSVRPVLVESKEVSKLRLYNNGKLTFEPSGIGLHYSGKSHTYQKLILISLDPNEKIEESDALLLDNEIVTCIGFGLTKDAIKIKCKIEPFIHKSHFKKVIATQDQLSPEHIQQLVDEYNNGGMQDFEIEMHNNLNDPERLCDFEEPYMPNGFVVVVEKYVFGIPNNPKVSGVDYENTPVPNYPIGNPLEDYINEKHSQDRCMGFIDGYNARKSEESIKYNEEQVIEYSYWLRTTDFNVDGHSPEDCLNEWFNENKKK